jgi:Family of unknown function (DUF6157)
MKDMNYYETFITVAADCPVSQSEVPPARKTGPTKSSLEYDLISKHPYTYTQEDLIYEVYIRHKTISEEEIEKNGRKIRDELFQKSQACLRASMLPKKYGWGLHFDQSGKIALYGVETLEYKAFLEKDKENIQLIPAMRNSRQR